MASNSERPVIVLEYCTSRGHGYGSFIDGPCGLQCVACLKATGELPSDYEACGECGFDHAYEPAEAMQAHADDCDAG